MNALKNISLFMMLLNTTLFLPVAAFSNSCPKSSPSEASQQMVTLANDISYHNRLYYEKASPEISDAESVEL